MKLGAFSISLAVKDIKASREFYEKFGFNVSGTNGYTARIDASSGPTEE